MLAAITLAQRLYDAFTRFDARALFDLLSNDFVGTVQRRDAPWSRRHAPRPDRDGHARPGIPTTLYDIHLEPAEYLAVDDNRVVVIGRYRGAARDGRSSVDTAFAHVITVRGGRVAVLRQITDTRGWELPPGPDAHPYLPGAQQHHG